MVKINVDAEKIYDGVWAQWVAQGGPALVAAAREEVGVDSGDLRDSIEFRPTGRWRGQLIATAPNAVVHMEGHGVIRPKDPDGVLSWLDKMSGDRVFAKSVRAVAGNPFLINAARKIGLRVR